MKHEEKLKKKNLLNGPNDALMSSEHPWGQKKRKVHDRDRTTTYRQVSNVGCDIDRRPRALALRHVRCMHTFNGPSSIDLHISTHAPVSDASTGHKRLKWKYEDSARIG